MELNAAKMCVVEFSVGLVFLPMIRTDLAENLTICSRHLLQYPALSFSIEFGILNY